MGGLFWKDCDMGERIPQRDKEIHESGILQSIGPFSREYGGLYDENHFKEMLCLERRRTERSRKPFLLMLIRVGELLEGANGNDVLSGVVGALFHSTRETDVKGWYLQDSILGIIFSEIAETGVHAAADHINSKILNGLRGVLNPEDVKRIQFSSHLFPGDQYRAHFIEKPDLTLYPDLKNRSVRRKIGFFFKRALDIVGSLGIIAFSFPVFLGIALAIKRSSKGPVLFKQQRVGQFGKCFTFFKFRSMVTDCDESVHKIYVEKLIKNQACYEANGDNSNGSGNDNGNGCDAVYKVVDDPRITPIGRFIRKTSLDELPQCFNVLKGDMSLVGPRPPIPYELECYDIWHCRRILEMKPGITGLWQVKGRSRTNFDEMVRLDLQYSREWSLWLDIKILLRTPYVALTGKGGY